MADLVATVVNEVGPPRMPGPALIEYTKKVIAGLRPHAGLREHGPYKEAGMYKVAIDGIISMRYILWEKELCRMKGAADFVELVTSRRNAAVRVMTGILNAEAETFHVAVILADWLEERGEAAAAQMLRETFSRS